MPRPINPSPTSPTGSNLASLLRIDTSIVPATRRLRQPRLCSPSSLMNAHRSQMRGLRAILALVFRLYCGLRYSRISALPKTGVPLGNGHYTISHRIGPHIDQFGADVNHFYFDQYLEVRGQDSRPVASHVASWVRSFWQPYFDNALPKSFLVVLHPGDADWRMVSPRRAANDAIQSLLLAQLPVSCLAVALESWGGLTASSTQRLAR